MPKRATPPASDATAAPTPDPQIVNFERSLDELEKLVAQLEQGNMGLDESLQSFERGIALFRDCQSALQHAELRVRMLLDPADPASAEPFDDGDV